jgi:NAD(P)-dependent dehydrogenase (short-subunit alcohol dehydrogenase family)
VVTVASQLHKRGQLHLDDLQLTHGYTGYNAYTQSKICNVLFAYALAERLRGAGVTSNVLHPGIITTKLLWAGFQSTANDIAESARTSIHLATAPELEGMTGKYFEPVREMPSAGITYDKPTQEELWRISEKMVSSQTLI